MQFQPHAIGDKKMPFQRFPDLPDAVNGQSGRAAAEIQARHTLSSRLPAAHHLYLFEQGIDIPFAKLPDIWPFAIRAKIADASAERDMDIQAKVGAFGIGKRLVVFLCEGERACRSCKPHPRQIRNDAHTAPCRRRSCASCLPAHAARHVRWSFPASGLRLLCRRRNVQGEAFATIKLVK